MLKPKMDRWGLSVVMIIVLAASLVSSVGTARAASSVPVNGNFEQGPHIGWLESSSNSFELVVDAAHAPVTPHGGNYLAWLGNASLEQSRVFQSVTIAPSTQVSFWYWIGSTDTCGTSFGNVLIDSTPIQTWNLCSSTATFGWRQMSLDLSSYNGSTVTFEFRTNNSSTSTHSGLVIDDVVFYDGPFTDVSLDYWADAYIRSIYNAGITGGCGSSPMVYCPTGMVTRDQMAIFLLKGIHGSSYTPPAVGGSTGFNDVPTSYWAAAWIKELAAEGITGGCGGASYCPLAPVTRDQMAVFLLKAEHGASYVAPAVGGSTGFSDVPTSYWAATWIKQLALEGITGGCGGSTYCPTNPVTRDQMAVFLQKSFSLPLP